MRRRVLWLLPALVVVSGSWVGAESRLDEPDRLELTQRLSFASAKSPLGTYYGTRTEVVSPLGKTGMYRISARLKTFGADQLAHGTFHEYSAALTRELYHITIKGRLGTAPPDLKYPAALNGVSVRDQVRPSYHLAGGEVLLTFYGDRLGPEHPSLTNVVWESSGTPPAPEDLDRTWVTSVHGVYTNTDHHIMQPSTLLVVVQNSWQFQARETYRENTSLAVEMGFDRYNKFMPKNITEVFLDNTEYWGDPDGAIFGWPNNHVSAQVLRRLGSVTLKAETTRLNLLANGLVLLYAGGAQWDVSRRLRLSAEYSYNRRRNTSVRRLIGLSAAYAW